MTQEPIKSAVKSQRPDLAHIETWVFDLDNTLYAADLNLFSQVDRRMGDFIAEALEISYDDARRVQKKYYRDHGTTLAGLMAEHQIEPEAYLDYVHDIDLSALSPSDELNGLIGALQGRKLIFTNGSVAHAERITAALDIHHHFEDIFDIAAAGYRPKHTDGAFRKFLERSDFETSQAVLFDDVPVNLKTAHAFGLTTVWIKANSGWALPKEAEDDDFIHHEADDLLSFLRVMHHRGRISS